MFAGFQPGCPPYLPGRALLADRQACAEMICPDCGTVGLHFAPQRKGFAYRGRAVCNECNFSEAF